MSNLNSFCKYCTGNNKDEILNCHFRYCPFYEFRMLNMEWQIYKQVKITGKELEKQFECYFGKY